MNLERNPMDHSRHEGAEASPEPVTCPRCGKVFACRLAADCWCVSLDVPESVRIYLAERYETCVCRTCLEELIDKEKRSQDPAAG